MGPDSPQNTEINIFHYFLKRSKLNWNEFLLKRIFKLHSRPDSIWILYSNFKCKVYPPLNKNRLQFRIRNFFIVNPLYILLKGHSLSTIDIRRRSNLCNIASPVLWPLSSSKFDFKHKYETGKSRAAVVHLNFRARSTYIPVCTVSPRHWVKKADTQ